MNDEVRRKLSAIEHYEKALRVAYVRTTADSSNEDLESSLDYLERARGGMPQDLPEAFAGCSLVFKDLICKLRGMLHNRDELVKAVEPNFDERFHRCVSVLQDELQALRDSMSE